MNHKQRHLRISATIGQQTTIFFYSLNTFLVTYSELIDLSTNRQSNYCPRQRQGVLSLLCTSSTQQPSSCIARMMQAGCEDIKGMIMLTDIERVITLTRNPHQEYNQVV
ncbi:hypothetical protein LOAG_12079 [Loa loa]|uniref:Uncharacterized protein n=1 Tax=Loa loa TaxID=7209 RepID=A0A1S0TLV8_LOALO|nr:hypothetical protein LOAG_12079 [Loa loa]EFO16426.1 hypothetical protein LOAG_12079 [Loa loa]